jgi:hypothetical protein
VEKLLVPNRHRHVVYMEQMILSFWLCFTRIVNSRLLGINTALLLPCRCPLLSAHQSRASENRGCFRKLGLGPSITRKMSLSVQWGLGLLLSPQSPYLGRSEIYCPFPSSRPAAAVSDACWAMQGAADDDHEELRRHHVPFIPAICYL